MVAISYKNEQMPWTESSGASFTLAAAECFQDRKAGAAEAAGGFGRVKETKPVFPGYGRIGFGVKFGRISGALGKELYPMVPRNHGIDIVYRHWRQGMLGLHYFDGIAAGF